MPPEDSLAYTIFHPFRFLCCGGLNSGSAIWFIDSAVPAMTLFKFHFIVIFMYTIIFTIVLYEIPYRYGRLMKTDKEIEADKKKRKKRRKKRDKKRGAHRKTDLAADITAYKEMTSSGTEQGRATMTNEKRPDFNSLLAGSKDSQFQ